MSLFPSLLNTLTFSDTAICFFFNTFKGNALYNIEPNLLIFYTNGILYDRKQCQNDVDGWNSDNIREKLICVGEKKIFFLKPFLFANST